VVLWILAVGVARPFPRPVRRRVVEAQVKWPVVAPSDELGRAVGEQVGHVPNPLGGDVVLPEVWLSRTADVREVIHAAAVNAEELVEPVAVGRELRHEAEVPLADERGAIPGALEQGRERRMARREAELGRSAFRRAPSHRPLELRPEALRVPTGHERDAGRRARRRGGVRVREANARGDQSVDVWRLIVGPAERAQVAVAEIVGENEEQVGATSLRESELARSGERRRADEELAAGEHVVGHKRRRSMAICPACVIGSANRSSGRRPRGRGVAQRCARIEVVRKV
jgi:hypothetical protein